MFKFLIHVRFKELLFNYENVETCFYSILSENRFLPEWFNPVIRKNDRKVQAPYPLSQEIVCV